MPFEIISAFSTLLEKQAITEIEKSNDVSARFGLALSRQDAVELVETRNLALDSNGRIEFGGGIINKIIMAFCSSPYLTTDNYAGSIHDLTEIFYFYKNETLDLIDDDDLIKFMRDRFNGICQGSLELLAGRELDNLVSSIRFGYAPVCSKDATPDESYFSFILQEAYNRGLLADSDMEDIQLRCLEFLAFKVNKYNCGSGSSIRVETAESIMKSIFFTVSLYLKSLPEPDIECAAAKIKTSAIPAMYQKGREIMKIKLHTARHLYLLVSENKLDTYNAAYNATIDNEGIGSFFKLYNPDYEAHETPASIDYPLCNQVVELTGVEYIHSYLGSLLLENKFCRYFKAEAIHRLLSGYDKGYRDLLINIFEHVLTAALGCSLAKCSILKLDIPAGKIKELHHELSKEDCQSIARRIDKAADDMLEELDIAQGLLRAYIEKAWPQIKVSIVQALRTKTLDKIIVCAVNHDSKTAIQFFPGTKIDDKEYRKLIDELWSCRYSTDKLALIQEKVKSFNDFEDVLLDAQLNEEEITALLGILGDVEIAALLKRHPFQPEIAVFDLKEAELTLRVCLKRFFHQLPIDKKEKIMEIMDRLVDD